MCEMIEKLVSGEIVDPVTRLPRKEFLEELKKLLKDSGVWLLEVDVTIDGVPEIYKDIAISKIASIIKHSVRIPKDMVVRIGDYEFAVLVSGVDKELIKNIAKRIKDNVDYMSLSIGGKSVNPTAVVRYEKL